MQNIDFFYILAAYLKRIRDVSNQLGVFVVSRTEKPPEPGSRENHVPRRSSRLVWLAENWLAAGMLASWLVSIVGSLLAGFAQLSKVTMLVAATLMVLSGGWHLAGVRALQRDRRYTRHPKVRQLLSTDRRFATRWIGCSLLVIVFALLTPVAPIAFELLSAVVVFFTYVNGFAIGTDLAGSESEFKIEAVPSKSRQLWEDRTRRAPRLPGVCWAARVLGHRRRLGEIGLALTVQLSLLACIGLAFVGLALGEVVKSSTDGAPAPDRQSMRDTGPSSREPPEGEPGGSGGTSPAPKIKTYAEACPELPDPTVIEHGLGELFQRAGAIAAGCGGLVRQFDGITPVWISEGICRTELRSLAVNSPGHLPVLLFGSPARFALETAEAGKLLFVDLKKPGGGEIAAIGTESGTYLFARRTPSITPGDPDAANCAEVGGVARPFARLRPPLGRIWLEYVEDFGWAWPLGEGANGDEVTFLDYDDPSTELRTSCEDGFCTMTGRGEFRVPDEPAFVRLDELVSYIPPRVE
jgi:hypothetical protein